MKEKLKAAIQRHKYVVLVLLAGMILMLLPAEKQEQQKNDDTCGNTFALEKVEQDLEEILSHMEGVGKVRVMLTLESGSSLQLASDGQSNLRDSETRQEKQVVKISRGSGQQEVVVTEEIYPKYLGAVIVCEGAGNSKTKLCVIEAVSVITSLPSDRISVVKWEDHA